MKNLTCWMAVIVLLAGGAVCGYAEGSDSKVAHRFLIGDHSAGGLKADGVKAYIIAEDGSVEWEAAAPSSQDMSILPNGNVIWAGHGAVTEINRDKEVIFNYKFEGRKYLSTNQRLSNGNTLIAVNPDNTLLEVNPEGEVVKTVNLDPEMAGESESLRLARQLENGHYLVAHNRKKTVVEYDEDGKPVWRVETPSGPYAALRLKDGNTLISCGDGNVVVEVNAKGETVWQFGNEDMPENMELGWMAGIERLPNGNTVMVCWYDRDAKLEEKSIPQVLEVTRAKEIVWTFTNRDLVGSASNVQILSTNGKEVHAVAR